MATSKAVTVQSTSVTTLVAAGQGSPDQNLSVAVYNGGAVTIYLGGPAVASTTGYPLAATTALPFLIPLNQDGLFAKAASSTAAVQVTVFGGV